MHFHLVYAIINLNIISYFTACRVCEEIDSFELIKSIIYLIYFRLVFWLMTHRFLDLRKFVF